MYDCIIVGAGPAGIFCAYELITKNPNFKVLLVDKGHNIYNRRCPILEGKLEKCPVDKKGISGCHPACSITSGFGGAGAYSDGKFNITEEFGGWLTDYLSNETVLELINYVDKIYLDHGATKTITDPNTSHVKEIEKRGIAVGLKLLRAKVRHLGTEENLKIMKSIYDFLENKIDMKFKTEVIDIKVEDNKVIGIILDNDELIEGSNILLAAGRDGSMWISKLCRKHDIKQTNNQVDIGVRVETNNIIMEEINEHLYEGKFVYNASVGTQVRTFCSNPSGHVVIENYNGTMLANGHSYHDPKLGSDNTNFAVLVSHVFKDPYDNPNEYGHSIGKIANKLSLGSIIVQRYGDLKTGRRTTDSKLKKGFVKPTLNKAIPGDLGLILPYNTLKSIVEMIEALDHVTPGIANEHTLLYGVETKFYSARPETDQFFETKVSGLYMAGDGAGLTRGLAQAGANGVWIARRILFKK
ncbi:NAD(P)/FAD-dependent oxidoreductase [Acholeplasma sp. OttesenSCG-928-E16]|nr:NAD(P)/FAD-dependent oxidoreductase [Acholeplasma sp. OttesenSCG-928-E16]